MKQLKYRHLHKGLPRRDQIALRRLKYKDLGTAVSKLPRDKHGNPVFKEAKRGGGRNMATPMSSRRRMQMLRYMDKKVNTGRLSAEEAGELYLPLMLGQLSTVQVYGFHPTKGSKERKYGTK